MALKDVKIKVKSAKNADKTRSFIAESIKSIDGINQSIRQQFGNVGLLEIYYKG